MKKEAEAAIIEMKMPEKEWEKVVLPRNSHPFHQIAVLRRPKYTEGEVIYRRARTS
jgi:hypothetical protein